MEIYFSLVFPLLHSIFRKTAKIYPVSFTKNFLRRAVSSFRQKVDIHVFKYRITFSSQLTKGDRICYPHICQFGIRIVLRKRDLRIIRCRKIILISFSENRRYRLHVKEALRIPRKKIHSLTGRQILEKILYKWTSLK